jgi:hypothetical protein
MMTKSTLEACCDHKPYWSICQNNTQLPCATSISVSMFPTHALTWLWSHSLMYLVMMSAIACTSGRARHVNTLRLLPGTGRLYSRCTAATALWSSLVYVAAAVLCKPAANHKQHSKFQDWHSAQQDHIAIPFTVCAQRAVQM